MKEQLLELLKKARAAIESGEGKTVQETYMLPGGEVLCLPRAYGDSRFPYDADGMVIWAHTTGYIDAFESLFNVFRTANYNEDAVVLFFAGEKQADGRYRPVSITGADSATGETGVSRYVIFGLRHAWYIAETQSGVYGMRMHIGRDKKMHFSVCAVNAKDVESEIYVSAYFEAFLRFVEAEGFFNRMTKYAERTPSGAALLYALNHTRDCLAVTRRTGGAPDGESHTVGRRGVLGVRGRNLANAEAWVLGAFTEEKAKANTTDLPVSGDLIRYTLGPGEAVRCDWCCEVIHDYGEAVAACERGIPDAGSVEAELAAWEKEESATLSNLKIHFDDFRSSIDEDDTFRPLDAGTFNAFIEKVQKQVSFCALGKNYAGNMLGIRDVYQQLESSLLWDPAASRAQIVRTLDFILSDGRAPRQIAFPKFEGDIPEMDLRPYIDQGPWIISTVCSYIAWTGDLTILDEKCGYYDCAATYGPLSRSPEVTTVYEHLCRIADFLCSNIDPETHCLHALYGDWNDALDGLGRTEKEGREFGNGVTVMATIQLRNALLELFDTAHARDNEDRSCDRYPGIVEQIDEGLLKYAVEEKDGRLRVIHGWGDDRAYKVGSFRDYDGEDRISITPNAFWAMSGLCGKSFDPRGLRDAVVGDIKSLDSKYGLLTFSRPLYPFDKRVGRISTITPGTYENCAVYVHAALFAGMGLFAAGESREAWRQMEKAVTATHKNATMTAFVMPNSYCCAPEWGADGDSMGDWYTGSGTVLIKELVRYGFGVDAMTGALDIRTPAYMPCSSASIEFLYHGKRVTLKYRSENSGCRRFLLDGEQLKEKKSGDAPALVNCVRYSENFRTVSAMIPEGLIRDGSVIEVID
ncbi:MAG: hypothetical protein IJR90_04705 [Clostridia bacterium]|nr:hypothetical protein [Clostridia bacterium]